MDKKIENAITYVLRCAISEGGRAYYPCMYNLGCADNIPPSDEFNQTLRQFGYLHYEEDIDDWGELNLHATWSYFEINENGRKFIAEKDKIINGPFNIIKLFRYIFSLILSLIQLVCVIEGWISYFLNLILKGISSILFILAILSFVWWPLDMLCGLIWSGCDYLKHRIWNKGFIWEASIRRWVEHFPKL